jgi:hypothetical protein
MSTNYFERSQTIRSVDLTPSLAIRSAIAFDLPVRNSLK